MANYIPIEQKATETVTIRLTKDERNTLVYLAEIGNASMTDIIRSMLLDRVDKLGIDTIPIPPKKRRPGRPKLKPQPKVQDQNPDISIPVFIETDETIAAPESKSRITHQVPDETTFGELVVNFKDYFSHRAEGTRRELEETIGFLCNGNTPLLPRNTVLSQLTSSRLQKLREDMRVLGDLRVAKKNLHLTYLRMMLHWAVKQPDIALNLNPALDLKPFTIIETKGGWFGGK